MQRGRSLFAPRRAPVPVMVIGAKRRSLSKVLWRYFRHESKIGANTLSASEMRMIMAKTISHCQGKGSLTHNNRKFSTKNVDGSRTKDNITFVEQSIADVYDDLFGAAVERYNAKQKRSDRKIKSGYFEHVFKRAPAQTVVTSADKRKSFYEDVVQIGTKDDTGVGTADAAVAAECLTEYMNGFQEHNPNFRVFNAVLHLDEATPHLHIDYIPVGHYKQGVDTQNGIAQALKEMGYGTGKDAISRWRESERAVLDGICKAHDIEIATPEKSRGSLTVEAYKEYVKVKEQVDEKKAEVARLDEKAENADRLLKHREDLCTQVEAVIDGLDEQYQEKSATVQRLDSEIYEKENKKAQTEAALEEKQAILNESAHKVFKLDFIDKMETGKTIFGGKVTISPEDYEILTDIAKKQIATESREGELTVEIANLKKKNEELSAEKEQLTEQNTQLRRENGELQSVYGRIALAKLRSELDNLQRKLDRVMEFIKGLGLAEKLQTFLNSNKKLHR